MASSLDTYGIALDNAVASNNQQPARPSYFHTMSLGLLIFLPIAIFTINSVFITLLYQSVACLCWILVGLSIGTSLVFMVVKQPREGPKYWFNLGALCFVATVFGFALSLWNFHNHMVLYLAYDGQREYSNVLPNTPSLQYLDAGLLSFSAGTKLDLDHIIAYRSGADSQTYCLAPVVGNFSGQQQTTIEFWAAGLNCCSSNSFWCGQTEAHAGLVLLSDSGIPDSRVAEFRQAAQIGCPAQGLTSSQDALFLQWSSDPAQAKGSIYTSGITFLVVSIVIYSVLSVVAGLTLHFVRRLPSRSSVKDKLTARTYMGSSPMSKYT